MTKEEKTVPVPPSTREENGQGEMSEQELKDVAGGGNPFSVTDENGNIINVLHGEEPERYGIL